MALASQGNAVTPSQEILAPDVRESPGRDASDLVFVTATDVPVKTINRILVEMFDFEYSDGIDDNSWIIVTSTDPSQISKVPTKPPVPENLLSDNAWAGRSFKDVGKFMLDNKKEIEEMDFTAGQCVILDQASIETGTGTFWDQIYEYDSDDEQIETGRWQGLRMPLGMLHGIAVNLWLANMGFEDFVDEDAGLDDGGLHKYAASRFEPSNESLERSHEEAERKRRDAWRALNEQGHVDTAPEEGPPRSRL